MPRPLTPDDIFAFESVADARIAPDGTAIIAILTRRDRTTDTRVPRLIRSTDRETWSDLADSEGVLTARWAPDSGRVALLRRRGDRYQVAIDGGGMRILHEAATQIRELAVSPDGRLIAFQQRIDAPLPAWLPEVASTKKPSVVRLLDDDEDE